MKAPLHILLVLAAACGPGPDGDGPTGGPPPPAAATCTGPEPANSMPCPGAGAGLGVDTPRVVTVACSLPVTPCSHVCNTGFVVEDGACVRAPVTPPATQLTDNGDGTITVTSPTGRLTWLRDSNCEDVVVFQGRALAGGTGTWEEATTWAAGLGGGVCGLADGSAPGDWRLPTHVELTRMALALQAGAELPGVQTGVYWTSWSYWPDKAAGVELFSGDYYEYPRTSRFRIWPVR